MNRMKELLTIFSRLENLSPEDKKIVAFVLENLISNPHMKIEDILKMADAELYDAYKLIKTGHESSE